jgi:hypothetical protein
MATNIQRGTTGRIRTLHQLQLEKARLKTELVRSEDKIKSNYKAILTAFALKNILSTVGELTGTPSFISQFVSLGLNWLATRKKKKKKKQGKPAEEEIKDEE